MKAITSARQGGKTTLMVAALHAHPGAVMVVASHRERLRLLDLYPDLRGRLYLFEDFTGSRPISIRPQASVLIDDLDLRLARVFGNVQIVSFTEEEQ